MAPSETVAILTKRIASVCLIVLFRFIPLFADFAIWHSGNSKGEKGTYLGHWQTFLAFLVVNIYTFDLNYPWSSLVCLLSIHHRPPSPAAFWTCEIFMPDKILLAVIWLDKQKNPHEPSCAFGGRARCFTFASLAFSFACVCREAVKSLV